MKRILVTGGAGFVGKHLCERLPANPNFELMRHEVTFPLFVEVDAFGLIGPRG